MPKEGSQKRKRPQNLGKVSVKMKDKAMKIKDRIKEGNRVSCLIEQVAPNHVLMSFKTSGATYRGVLINENCSTVQRSIPENYYPKKQILRQEVTENLLNAITERDLDTTSKETRSKKLRQSCIILDDYDLDATAAAMKSPIDSIRGLVESISTKERLPLLPTAAVTNRLIANKQRAMQSRFLNRSMRTATSKVIRIGLKTSPYRSEPKILPKNGVNRDKLSAEEIERSPAKKNLQGMIEDNESEKEDDIIKVPIPISQFVPQNSKDKLNDAQHKKRAGFSFLGSKPRLVIKSLDHNVLDADNDIPIDVPIPTLLVNITPSRVVAQASDVIAKTNAQTTITDNEIHKEKQLSPQVPSTKFDDETDNNEIDKSENSPEESELPDISEPPKKLPRIEFEGSDGENVSENEQNDEEKSKNEAQEMEINHSDVETPIANPSKSSVSPAEVSSKTKSPLSSPQSLIPVNDTPPESPQIPEKRPSALRKKQSEKVEASVKSRDKSPVKEDKIEKIKNEHRIKRKKRKLITMKKSARKLVLKIDNEDENNEANKTSPSASKVSQSSKISEIKKKLATKQKRVDPITLALNNIRKFDSVRKRRGKNLMSTFNLDDDVLRNKKIRKRKSLRSSAIAKRKELATKTKERLDNTDKKSSVEQVRSPVKNDETDVIRRSSRIKDDKTDNKFINKNEESLKEPKIKNTKTEKKSRREKFKENEIKETVNKSTIEKTSESEIPPKAIFKKLENKIRSSERDIKTDQNEQVDAPVDQKYDNCKVDQPKKTSVKKTMEKESVLTCDTRMSIADIVKESVAKRKSLDDVVKLCATATDNKSLPEEKCDDKILSRTKSSLEEKCDDDIVPRTKFEEEDDKLKTEHCESDNKTILENNENNNFSMTLTKVTEKPPDNKSAEKDTVDLLCHEKPMLPDEAPKNIPRVKNRRKPVRVFKSLPNPAEQEVLVDFNEVPTVVVKLLQVKSEIEDELLVNSLKFPKRNLFKLRPRLLPVSSLATSCAPSDDEEEIEEVAEESEEPLKTNLKDSAVIPADSATIADDTKTIETAKPSPTTVETVTPSEPTTPNQNSNTEEAKTEEPVTSSSCKVKRKTFYEKILERHKQLRPIKHHDIRIGDVVWGRCHGYGWWPGVVVTHDKSKRQADVDWLGSTTNSKMSFKDLNLFVKHLDKHFKRKSSSSLKQAVFKAIAVCEEKYGVL